MSANDATILLAIGSTGSGKSTWLVRELKRAAHSRLFVWDVKGEYAAALGVPLVKDWTTAARCLHAIAQGRELRIAFQPPRDNRAVMLKMFSRVLELAVRAGNMALVVEEAGMVLEPGTGNPHAWQNLVSLDARDKKIALYVASQRPARIDKDTFSNCTRMRVFKLSYPEDQDVMRRALGVPLEAVAALEKLQFFELDTDNQARLCGELHFTGEGGERVIARAPERPGSSSKPPGPERAPLAKSKRKRRR